MQHSLSHRIGHKIQQVQTDKISVGYGRFRELYWQHTEETGVVTQNDITIAVCGFFTHTAQSHTPQQLIALYQQRGIDALCRLQGSFLIALHDNEHGYLIRDGAGQRTLYYSVQNGKLFFAIEPKGLHQMSGFPRRLNPDALVQYLCFSFVPGNNTMLEDLHELPPGHYLRWHNDYAQPFLHRYYRFERIEKLTQSEPEWIEQFQQTFSDCVADRLASQQEVGVFLSGGMDSSVVTAELAQTRSLSDQLSALCHHCTWFYASKLFMFISRIAGTSLRQWLFYQTNLCTTASSHSRPQCGTSAPYSLHRACGLYLIWKRVKCCWNGRIDDQRRTNTWQSLYFRTHVSTSF